MFYTNHCEFTYKDTDVFKIYGRTLADESGLILSWSASGIGFNFKGERAVIAFAEYKCDAPVFVKVFIDGKSQRFCLCGSQPRIVLDCEKDGIHSVKFLRISEGETYLRFKNVTVYGKEPEFKAPPKDKSLKLEFLGDSITTGWGVLATCEPESTYNTVEQDVTRSYGYMTAELLDADIHIEAVGGQGVWRTCGKEEGIQFKHMFDMVVRGNETYDHSSWIPDVIVLHCGTNDEPGGTTEEDMHREGNILLDKVRTAYPNAKIIWMYGAMNSKFLLPLKKLINERRSTGDKDVYFFPVTRVKKENHDVGAVGHPNVNFSVKTSKKLSNFIKKIL